MEYRKVVFGKAFRVERKFEGEIYNAEKMPQSILRLFQKLGWLKRAVYRTHEWRHYEINDGLLKALKEAFFDWEVQGLHVEYIMVGPAQINMMDVEVHEQRLLGFVEFEYDKPYFTPREEKEEHLKGMGDFGVPLCSFVRQIGAYPIVLNGYIDGIVPVFRKPVNFFNNMDYRMTYM